MTGNAMSTPDTVVAVNFAKEGIPSKVEQVLWKRSNTERGVASDAIIIEKRIIKGRFLMRKNIRIRTVGEFTPSGDRDAVVFRLYHDVCMWKNKQWKPIHILEMLEGEDMIPHFSITMQRKRGTLHEEFPAIDLDRLDAAEELRDTFAELLHLLREMMEHCREKSEKECKDVLERVARLAEKIDENANKLHVKAVGDALAIAKMREWEEFRRRRRGLAQRL